MTEKEFNEIAKEVTESKGDNIDDFEYYSYYKCPDQYVGKIKNVIKKKRFWRKNINKFDCSDPIFVLLQESPHQDEYEYDEDVSKRVPIGPSNGGTGVKIWKCLRKKLGELGEDYGKYKDFSLILMNPIQYQCSLGRETKHYRTRMFRKIFSKDDLGERILEICKISTTVVILPAPTSAVKQKIEEFLNELKAKNIENLKILPLVSHPSTW